MLVALVELLRRREGDSVSFKMQQYFHCFSSFPAHGALETLPMSLLCGNLGHLFCPGSSWASGIFI